MNKNKLAILAALAMSITTLPALAQQNNGGGMMQPPGQGQGGGQGFSQQKFEARKADILSHLQQAMACVQAASDPQSLRACRPNRGGPGGGGDQGGGPRGGSSGGGNMGGGDQQGGGDDAAPPPPEGSDD